MKELLISAVMLGVMAGQLPAQNSAGDTVALSLGVGVFVSGSPNFGWWVDPPPCTGRAGRRFPSFAYACDPLYAGNKGEVDPAPSISIAIPQTFPAPVAPSRLPPTRPERREYHWPSSGSDSSAAVFSIVSKDGRVQSANTLWVQGETLSYSTPDGGIGRMPIESIDRQATRRRNAEKQLNFWLPAEN